MRKAIPVLVLSLCWPVAGGAQPQTPQYPELPVATYVLPSNGLQVILHEDHRLPLVAVNMWYHVGPLNEEPGRTGFAHLFEHLMFQGSEHTGDDAHFQLLERAGASAVNGTTSYDRTNYYETLPRNELALALWLESDRMGFLALTQDKLDNQREVVLNERRESVENVPYGLSGEKMVQTLFEPGHPYHGAVIGSMDDLRAATLDETKAFFTSHYAPANATLVVAGDFDPAATRGLIDRYFGTLPRREPPPRPEVQTAPIHGQRRATVTEPVMLPMVQLGFLSPPFLTPGDAEADVLAYILGAGRSSRLHRKLVRELEIAQAVDTTQESNALTSTFTVAVTGRPGVDLAELEARTWEVIEEIRHTPPSDREVRRARNMLVTGSLESLESVGSVADRLNAYNHYKGDPHYLAEDLGRYDRVTPAAVQGLAADLLDPERAAVVLTKPGEAESPRGGTP